MTTRYTSRAKYAHLQALGEVEDAAGWVIAAYRRRADAMRKARAAGASLENIGRAAGLTRMRVWQILDDD